MDKSADAFRTITEVAEWLDTPAHVLRFWESRFTQIKPVKRAGGRRYYRPADMLLLGGIKKLLHDDGTTIKGVQAIFREHGIKYVQSLSQPVSVSVAIKKKSDTAGLSDIGSATEPQEKPVAPAVRVAKKAKQPVVEAPTEKEETPFIRHAVVEKEAAPTEATPQKDETPPAKVELAAAVAAPPVAKEEPAKQAVVPDDLGDEDIAALTGDNVTPEALLHVPALANSLKRAAKISHDDLQEIEALYYSLKMVRNNMHRTGAGH
ncbi:MAG: hypothetical protein COB84_04635 [Rhodobacteraceae bacterium]|nr:MAG: hypothetical protein COB84_04635 [Paracoccaceae bacterium]